MLRLLAVSFGDEQISIRGRSAKVDVAAAEEGARLAAKSVDELARFARLDGGVRQLQQQVLKDLLRLRRAAGCRIPVVSGQWRTIHQLSIYKSLAYR